MMLDRRIERAAFVLVLVVAVLAAFRAGQALADPRAGARGEPGAIPWGVEEPWPWAVAIDWPASGLPGDGDLPTVAPTVSAAAVVATPAGVPSAPVARAPSGGATGECPAVIVEVFGARAPAACAVSWCESSWNPGATGAEGEMGYFQIHPRWHPDATYDPLGNVLAAFRISSGGVDWSQWTCRRVLG
jgi:hypothetical protein